MRSPGLWSTFHDAVVRPVASLTLVVAATLLLAPALLVHWSRTQIYDSDSFADSAVAALEQEEVRDALVRAIVDEIVRVGSVEAISFRPLIEFVTTTIVDSLAFREIFRESVVELHRDIFTDRDPGDPVALTLVDAVIVVTAYVRQAYPEVADQLPANLETAFVEIRGRDWAVEVVTFGQDVTLLAIVLPSALVALYIAALLFSRDRRQTIVFIGLGWVAVAVLLVVGRDSARDLVAGQGFADQAVSRVVWDVYTRSLLGWAALVGGFGLLLAVAAQGAHRANPARQAEIALRALAYTPGAQGSRVARAVVFICLGVLVVYQREQVLELAVLLLAAYAVYYGLSELIWLASGTQEAVAPGRGRIKPTRRIALQAGAIAALLVASVGGYFYVYQALETAGGEAPIRPIVSECNGYRQLCDRRLNEIVFLGSHNSMAAASEPGWYFPQQLTSIPAQLESGVRALLIDTYYGYSTGRGVRTADRDFVAESLPPDEYGEAVVAAARRLAALIGGVQPGQSRNTYLCHSFCELGAKPFVQALAEINGFLDQNPGEVVLIFLQDQITPEDTARAFIASGLVRRVHALTPGEPLPTLRELIERDSRVLVFADNDASGVDWYMQAFEFMHDTPFDARSVADFSCDLGRGNPDAPLFAMNHWLNEPFPSTASARVTNSFNLVYNRVAECHLQRSRKVNLVIVNFQEIGEVDLVVDYLNGVGQRPPRQ